jgi:hypothetical protein
MSVKPVVLSLAARIERGSDNDEDIGHRLPQ